MKRGTHVLLFWTRLQSSVALCSGEAELSSLVKGVGEVLCIYNLMKELLSVAVHVSAKCDSSAARGVAHRVGVGKLKHVEVKHFWIQEKVNNKLVEVTWIPRKHNPSDLLTHTLPPASFRRLLEDFDVLWQLPPVHRRHLRGGVNPLLACVRVAQAIWLTSYVMCTRPLYVPAQHILQPFASFITTVVYPQCNHDYYP